MDHPLSRRELDLMHARGTRAPMSMAPTGSRSSTRPGHTDMTAGALLPG